MSKILVISDTHSENFILEEIINLEKPDYILHAGDHELDIDWLNKMNITYVKGNNDYFGPDELIIKIENKIIALVHGHKQYSLFNWHQSLYNYFKKYNPDIIIYGHSHKETIDNFNNKTIIINPGSITYPRNKDKIRSYITIKIHDNKMKIDIKKIGK